MLEFPLARQKFYQEIKQPESQIDLGKAALYIAQEAYPNLDLEEYLNTLAMMAAEVKKRLAENYYPLKMIKTINQYLFQDLGYKGNGQNYYDPNNSFLNTVIDRRIGIPISLSLVYLEIARRIDFAMVGIGMPGHFLIRPEFAEVGIFVDPFNQGEVLFEQDCEALLSKIYQQPVKINFDLLQPINKWQFLARMLTNLKFIYLNRGELDKAVGVVERILLLYPEHWLELRDRGLLYYQLQQFRPARLDLELYLEKVPQSSDHTVIRNLLTQIEQSIE